MISRHSKIVCTIGPATRSPRMIRKLMQAGNECGAAEFLARHPRRTRAEHFHFARSGRGA